MKTKAVRMYGEFDLRLEEFELPEIKENEILVKVMSDSICKSTYKLIKQGKNHKRAPKDIDVNPIIVGHEFAGIIEEVGEKWKGQYKKGQKFALQPALNYKGSLASPGYSYQFFGGACTYCIIPHEAIELGCLLKYEGDAFFEASLGEPMSCVVGAYHGVYHTNKVNYDHAMGIKNDGELLLMGACGPMGLGAISYGLCAKNKPRRIVVTDIDQKKIDRAKKCIPIKEAKARGIELIYINTSELENPKKELLKFSEGKGFDDIFVFVPYKPLVELADSLLAFDGCMNFFAGPVDHEFRAEINLYNCHYTSTHIMGTTGGNTEDLKEAIDLSAKKEINPAVMVTHIGGINAVVETTCNLPDIPGGKKLMYMQLDMPLTAIDDFKELGKNDHLFAKLYECIKENSGLWNSEAEKILFEHFGVS